jgi:hypothetical protein
LYKLAIKPFQALLHDTISLSELWHRRVAHIHYRALPALGKMVTGLPEIQIQHKGVCKGCALGKNVKGSFPSSDNSGSMTVTALNVYLYYVLFIDDHSTKNWIYFLKNKDGVLAKFQEFKAQVETIEENTPQKNLIVFVLKHESRGSSQFLTTLNKMGLLKGKTKLSLRQLKQ